MKQTHFPYITKTVGAGANTQSDEELLGAGEDGEYLNARNARTNDMEGSSNVSVKIKGEELLLPDVDNSCTAEYGGGALPDGWECLLLEEIHEQLIEVWANENTAINPFLRIDGVIVASHEDLPFLIEYPLQWDKDESCVGGEIFITDFRTPPIILNIKDMLLNNGVGVGDETGVCTEKYYEQFNIGRYTVNLDVSMDSFKFIRITSNPYTLGVDLILGTGGLPCGQYQYQFRFVDEDGNRSSFSPPTVMIPVPQQFDSASTPYPYSKTFGGEAAEDTGYGIHLRTRINNPLNYDYIEVKRIPYNNGEGLGFTPNGEIIGVWEIAHGERSVVNIVDYGAEPEEEILVEEDVMRLSAIQAAKAIRYFGRRLNLMNIKYASRDLDAQVTYKQLNGVEMFPVQKYLGKSGHADPYDSAYHKSYKNNEYYGFGVILYDGQGNYSFVDEVENFDNYKFPHRREEIGVGNSHTFSSSQRPLVKSMMGDLPTNGVWEIFDLHDPIEKTDACSFINIYGCQPDLDGTVHKLCNPTFCPTCSFGIPLYVPWCADPWPAHGVNHNPSSFGCSPVSCVLTAAPPFFMSLSYDAPYTPFHPTSYTDPNVNGHNYVPNVRVGWECQPASWTMDKFVDYNPQGFSPDWYSMGMGFAGLETYPTWAKGFSIVRTKAAGRVVAEGIGMYKLNPAVNPNQTSNNNDTKATKDKHRLWFYSSDIENAIGVNPQEVQLMQATPSNYKVQLISPMGFFSEMYHGRFDDTQVDHTVDLISYARLQYEDGSINIKDTPSQIGDNGHVQFGSWRNDATTESMGWATQQGTEGRATDANGELKTFGLAGITFVTDGDRLSPKFELTLGENVYRTSNIAFDDCNKRFNHPRLRKFHEPFYIVQIIRDDVQIPQGQTTKQFIGTGHYQKIEAIIGVGNGNYGNQYKLVDERWEDCCPALDPLSPFAGDLAYVWIENDQEEYDRWLNVTYQTQVFIDAVHADILANGFFLDANGFEVYGVYTHTSTSDERETTLIFDDTTVVVPFAKKIMVKYDNRLPIKFWGGDVVGGEDLFAPIDRNSTCQCTSGVAKNEEFRLNLGFPYYDFTINNRYYVPSNQTMAITQQCNTVDLNYIRQMVIMYPSQTRSHTWYCYEERITDEFVPSGLNGYFPATHYIVRPCKFDCDDPNDDYCDGDYWISTIYRDDYPNSENLTWAWGGFRYNKLANADYSREPDHIKYTTKPIVGFVEETDFCTRHIWTPERNIAAQDTPSLRTFPELNHYDLDDAQGGIKRAFSSLSDKGHNLYAITDSGIAMVLTGKKILSDINATEIALMGSGDNQFVQLEYWLSRVIGMNDETWRSYAEWNNVLYWTNFNSAYQLLGNEIVDIGRKAYYPTVRSEVISKLGVGHENKLCGNYDTLHNEYWVDISRKCVDIILVKKFYDPMEDFVSAPYVHDIRVTGLGENSDGRLRLPAVMPTATDRLCVTNNSGQTIIIEQLVFAQIVEYPIEDGDTKCFSLHVETGLWQFEAAEDPCFANTLVYNPLKEHWNGKYDYIFDKYISFNGRTFACRDGLTYELNKGYIINGEEIEYELSEVFAPAGIGEGEFKRVRIASDEKPTSVDFRNFVADPIQAEMSTANFGQFYLKNYNGWEQHIPRKSAAPHDRFQGRSVVVGVKHKGEAFVLKMMAVQFAPMK